MAQNTIDFAAQSLYLAYFGRPADNDGFANAKAALSGLSLNPANASSLIDLKNAFFAGDANVTGLANVLANSSESQRVFGDIKANPEAFVNAVFASAFGRPPVAAGRDFWVNEIKGGLNPAGAAIAIIAGAFENAAAQADRDTVISKLAYAQAFTDAANTPEEKALYAGAAAGDAGRAYLATITSASDKDVTNIAKAAEDAVKALSTNSTFTLTEGRDVQSANIFEAPRGFTPGGTDQVNTLDDDDVLTGTGTNPTLNFTFVDDADIGTLPITPTLNGITTVNVNVQGAFAKTLDLQDATGVDNFNISRINTSNLVQLVNIKDGANNAFSINNSSNPLATVNFAHLTPAVSGTADETSLTLNNAQLLAVNLDNTLFNAAGGVVTIPTQGYETINLASTGSANVVNVLGIYGNNTLNITGDQNIRLGAANLTANAANNNVEASNFAAGLNGVSGFLNRVDASALTGSLQLHIGTEINANSSGASGAPIQLNVTGGTADDTFVLTAGAVVGGATNNTDIIDGGAGTDKLVVVGPTAITPAATPNIRNIEGLEVRSGHDANNGADVIAIDADAFDSLATVFVRNEGQDLVANTVNAELATVNLVDLSAAAASAITVEHGTTGNNALGSTVLNVDLKAPGAADTVAIALQTGLNTDTRFNLTLNALSNNEPAGTAQGVLNVENVSIADNDNESNTVLLQAFAGHTGTITLTGGQAGQFMNLDANAGGVYGLGANGAPLGVTGDAVAVTADAAVATAIPLANRIDSASPNAGLRIFDGLAGDVRLLANAITADTSANNIIVRLGETGNAPTNVDVKTGTGNDSIIFDAIAGVQINSAGLSSADKVSTGTGFDTVLIDGASATGIVLDPTEFSNFSGVDALRFVQNAAVANTANNVVTGANGGGYRVAISNELVKQTDAGNRLLIINNEGDLTTEVESDLVLNLRNLAGDQLNTADSRLVTFVGANGDGLGVVSSNRIQMSESSATNGMILNGGDTDIAASTGNNNALEVFGNANLTINDTAQMSNFGRVEFTNDGSPVTSSTLALNDVTLQRLVDTSGVGAERLAVVANNSVNAITGVVSGLQQLTVTGDTLAATSNVDVVLAGGLNNISLGAGTDQLVFTGNFNAAQAAAKPNIVVGQNGQQITAASRATGINEFGVDGIAGNADDAAARLAYTGTYALGAGADFVRVYGAADLTGAVITGATGGTIIYSNVSLSESQLDSTNQQLGAIQFASAAGQSQPHVLNIVQDAGDADTNVTLSNVTVAAGTGVLTVNLNGLTQVGNINFAATAGDDTITGSNLNDTINGLAGNDVLNGGDGNDTIDGGDGFDTVVGGNGNDTLTGGGSTVNGTAASINDGFDVIAGLAGNDTITLTVKAAGADGILGNADDLLNRDEVHFRSIDGTDTVANFQDGIDLISFLDTGTTDNATGSVNFAASADAGGNNAAGTLLDAGDFETAADALTFNGLTIDAHVIKVGTDAAPVAVGALAAANVTNSYVLLDAGANVEIYYDADWTDATGQTLVATLVGVNLDDLTAADFSVYNPAAV